MAKVDWKAMYPEGYVTSFTTRHMPVSLHRRVVQLGKIMGISGELVLVQALEIGTAALERRVFAGEGERGEGR